ncbi:MAG: N-acetyltransferase family protein [Candidatus Rokubacteria bacterium]|nr:N-acetyltransferase family protein [Candidatus Rokubacteria bacterium]
MTAGVTLRPAAEADAETICLIYNQGIEDRIATLETELRTPVERRHWLASRSHRHPVILAEACVPERAERSEPPGRAGDSPGARLVEPPERSEPPGRAGDSPGARPVVIGWGSLNQFNPRKAYEHVADFSVYVEREWRGKGLGRRLLERLIELAREIGYHKMVLSTFPFNESGVALYERLGFRRVGVYREQGMLDGKWVDTLIMEMLL